MASLAPVTEDFDRRSYEIPKLGLGLSVDVYSPDLIDLMNELALRDLRPAYLELFKATGKALESVRRQLYGLPLTYHGEGLWVTQPDCSADPFFKNNLGEAIQHLEILQSPWLNHECATKQMAGYSFGTYLPPLYTRTSAYMVADNIELIQQTLDLATRVASHGSPLFLLEMPPLTYFSAGTIDVPEFFRLVTDRVSCGLVLDMGHLWTLYRYAALGRGQSLERFVGQFLDEFPLNRVVEIHVAGLAEHESVQGGCDHEAIPAWIDAHAAPIPSVLFSMLEQVLAHPSLINLRAVALEVDTKPIALIVKEFHEVTRRFDRTIRGKMAADVLSGQHNLQLPHLEPAGTVPSESDRRQLSDDYARYAKIVSGQMQPTGPEWQFIAESGIGLNRYTKEYLPNEILHWGGDLPEMFSETCRALAEQNIALGEFVAWWFQRVRPAEQPYDFFLLKIRHFAEFVCERASTIGPIVKKEASILRRAYAETNDVLRPSSERELTG